MTPPWAPFYPPGTRARLPSPAHASLEAMIDAAARAHAGRLAFTCCLPNGMNGSLRYRDVARESDAFAAWLRTAAGLRPGDRVAVQLPNCLAYPVAAFGVLKAGGVLVNTNPLYTPDEMAHQFSDAGVRVLVALDLFADRVGETLRRVPVERVVLARLTEYFPGLIGGTVRAIQRYWHRQIPEPGFAHARWAEALAAGASAAPRSLPPAAGPETLALLQYTGGTTGVAKGAMLTHGNLLWNCAQVAEMAGDRLRPGEECVLTAIPLYHIFAFTANLLAFWNAGAHNVLVPNPRPLANLQRAFENYPLTWITGVNTLYNGLAQELWFHEYPPRRLRGAIAGGMALQEAVAARWEALTGVPILEGYGMTESSPVLSFNPFGRPKPGSIGIPVPDTELACVAEDGRVLPPGEAGEIVARGPQVFAGYWQRPGETAEALRDGWLRTGDIGVQDEEGYFRIVDRKKDMILVSGFNVYPNEVEDCLARLEGVAECAVVGVPDGAAGEAVKAFIVRRDPALTAEAVLAHCRGHLTGYKLPRHIEFRDSLPKTPVGKILRKDLRAAAPAGGG